MAKMYKQLAKLTLVTSFGRGSERPLRKALAMIGCGLLLASATGYTLSKSLNNLGLARDIPSNILFVITASIFFTIIGFMLIPLAQKLDHRQSISSKNLLTLPLSKLARWFVIILPFITVTIILTLFFIPILHALSEQLSDNFLALFVAYLLGLSASLGLAISNIRSSFIKFTTFVCISAGQLYLIDLIIESEDHAKSVLFILIIAGVLVICSLGILYRYLSGVSNRQGKSMALRVRVPKLTLKNFWYGLKVLRNKKTIASLVFCLVVGASLVVFSFLRHQTTISPHALMIFAAVLAACLACDFRGVSRHNKTPEILALKNVTYFVNSQIKSNILLTSLVVSPIAFYLIKLRDLDSIIAWFYFTSIVFAALMVGLLSSAIFVPENGEIGSQFFSALLAVSILFIVPKLLSFSSLTSFAQAIGWLCVAGICCLGMILTENRRQRNYGHI